MAQEGGGNDEERGHITVAVGRLWRAPRHASPLPLDLQPI
jgi:hypothetical protein